MNHETVCKYFDVRYCRHFYIKFNVVVVQICNNKNINETNWRTFLLFPNRAFP